MKIDDILKLVNAGFNKEEITALMASPEPQPEPKPDPQPVEEKAEPADNTGDIIKALETQLQALTEAFHERNAREMDSKQETETTDDILRKMFEG